MRSFDAFPGPGRFMKGCLHTHTTRSDGRLTPEQALEVYRRSGYDFVALTDHNVFNREAYGMDADLLVLPAMEIQMNPSGRDMRSQTHHFVTLARGGAGFAHDERMKNGAYEKPEDVQAFIDRLRDAGNLVMLCHPFWSKTTIADYGSFTGLFAMEVFNTGCHYEDNTGLSYVQWDEMLRSGVRLFAAAVDDAHCLENVNGGWVQVYAAERSQKAVVDALEQGRFYASTGPEIHSLTLEDRELTVRCSPCRRIFCLTDRIGGPRAIPQTSGALMEARFAVPDKARYVRVECVADENRIAWSQPIWLDGPEG